MKLIGLLFLLLLPLALADSHLSNVDFTNTEEVNNLNPADLALSIQNGNIAHLNIITDFNLAATLSEHPLLWYKDPNVGTGFNPTVIKEVNKRAKDDITFLNGNPLDPDGKKPSLVGLWFNAYGISAEENVQLVSFNGKEVVTLGEQSTLFNPEELQKYVRGLGESAEVLDDGTLVILGKATIRPGMIFKKDQADVPAKGPAKISIRGNTLRVLSGELRLSGDFFPKRMSFTIEPGARFAFDNHHFNSGKPFSVTVKSKRDLSFSGGVMNAFTRQPHNRLERVSFTKGLELERFVRDGEVQLSAWIPAGSKYLTYINDKSDHKPDFHKVLSITSDVPVRVAGRCWEEINCITISGLGGGYDPLRAIVSLRDGSAQIKTTARARFIETLPLGDEASILITHRGKGVRVTSNGQVDPYRSSDLRSIPEIKARHENQDRVTLVKNGKITRCLLGNCVDLASAREAGSDGKMVHLAAARLDGQQSSREAAVKGGTAFVGAEGANALDLAIQKEIEDADMLAITGHHYHGTTTFWGEGGGMDLTELHPSLAVRTVAFSACNSVKDPSEFPDDPVLPEIERKFPNAEVVFGYSTKAPLTDGHIWERVIPMLKKARETGNYEPVKNYVRTEGFLGRGKVNTLELGVFVREPNGWVFCKPGFCSDVPMVVASVDSSEVSG